MTYRSKTAKELVVSLQQMKDFDDDLKTVISYINFSTVQDMKACRFTSYVTWIYVVTTKEPIRTHMNYREHLCLSMAPFEDVDRER